MTNLRIYTCLVIVFEIFFGFVVSTFIGTGGPSCTVTSLIPANVSFLPPYAAPLIQQGTPQATTTSMSGSCFSALSCRSYGGVAIGRCGAANSCCVFPRTCDAVSAHNHTYFTNPGYPSPYNGSTSCTLTIHRVPSLFKICQIRLDFVDFELNRPIEGNCETDRFIVSGQNANSIVPPLCGRSTGSHLYMDVDGAQGPFTFRVITNGPGYRRWNIQVTQIECNNPSRAPTNCLQYYVGPSGTFSSFNYESSRYGDFSSTAPQQTQPYDASYLNGLDYAICFRKESGFCTQTYHVNSTYTPFEILNIGPNNNPTFDQQYGGAGIQKCAFDYLQLNGMRFCGSRLNPLGVTGNPNTDAPVADISSGPFIARFVSDERITGRGFKLSFQQNPCGSRIQQVPTITG